MQNIVGTFSAFPNLIWGSIFFSCGRSSKHLDELEKNDNRVLDVWHESRRDHINHKFWCRFAIVPQCRESAFPRFSISLPQQNLQNFCIFPPKSTFATCNNSQTSSNWLMVTWHLLIFPSLQDKMMATLDFSRRREWLGAWRMLEKMPNSPLSTDVSFLFDIFPRRKHDLEGNDINLTMFVETNGLKPTRCFWIHHFHTAIFRWIYSRVSFFENSLDYLKKYIIINMYFLSWILRLSPPPNIRQHSKQRREIPSTWTPKQPSKVPQ